MCVHCAIDFKIAQQMSSLVKIDQDVDERSRGSMILN